MFQIPCLKRFDCKNPFLQSQESGVRSQETGVRGQESGVRSQETGDRRQGTGVSKNKEL